MSDEPQDARHYERREGDPLEADFRYLRYAGGHRIVVAGNGEKKLLMKGVTLLVTLLATGMTMMTAVASWAIKDYLHFKEAYHVEMLQHSKRDAALEERMRWQEQALAAIAGELKVPIPPPPNR